VFEINVEETQVKIEMLGGFTIIAGDTRVTEQVKRPSKVWKLLQYLIAHRNKSIPQEEIIDVFFADDEGDNPGGAVRTMIYRARAALAAGGLPDAEDMIVAKSGGYAWNNSVRCAVDAEEFEAVCKKADSAVGDEERLELLLKAASLYRGDFLPNASGEIWVMPLARWYRTMYIGCVHAALDLLAGFGRDTEAEELCVKALRMDPYDEKLLEHHLRTLLALGKKVEALEEYNRMETMFYDVLGVEFSENLRALYAQIHQPEAKENRTLEHVLHTWLEDASFPGAYYCDLSVFRSIYQIEARSALRSGRTTYIVRFDTKPEAGAKDGGVMTQLGRVIPVTLRKGDLYTRSSPSQFMLMLNSLTYENCQVLVSRILGSLNAKFLSKVIGTTIRPIEPIV
jgi:DNA-binding SARP family transcriptional activator